MVVEQLILHYTASINTTKETNYIRYGSHNLALVATIHFINAIMNNEGKLEPFYRTWLTSLVFYCTIPREA